jgi:hypothetical protein
MYKFDEQALRRGIRMGLGSQGIWTPELEDVMFAEITDKALRIHDVVGRSEQLAAFLKWYYENNECPDLVTYEVAAERYLSR